MSIYHTSEQNRTAYSLPIEDAFATHFTRSGKAPNAQQAQAPAQAYDAALFLSIIGADLDAPRLQESLPAHRTKEQQARWMEDAKRFFS